MEKERGTQQKIKQMSQTKWGKHDMTQTHKNNALTSFFMSDLFYLFSCQDMK